MPLSIEPAPQRVCVPLVERIVKHRNILWGTLIVLALLAFNGRWRVGRDSALYRGLGHSLATGKGYTFGEFGSRQIYPGLPVLLAGLEKVFGGAAWPAIVIVEAMALGCLIFTYKLVRLRYPQWVAIIVTFCVGINGWFLELANEIRDDIPFLLGLMIALYAWERLRIAIFNGADDQVRAESKQRAITKSIVYLVVGLALAAVMRPTFWILAIAWVTVCGWGLLVGPKRRFYAICLGILFVVWVIMALLDPRVRGFNPIGGGYERDAIASLRNVAVNVQKTLPEMINSELAYSFFGQKWLPGMTQLMNVVAILAPLLLIRRNWLWPLLVYITVAVTLVMTAVPRYYVMVLPIMMLSWILLTVVVAQNVPPKWVELTLVLGIAAVVAPNFARCCKVIGEQHGWNRRAEEGPKWKYVLEMSEAVRTLVPPGEKVIAPGATIMSYTSGREVVMQKDIIPTNKSPVHWPTHLAALNIHYAVFPSNLYGKGEREIRELMDRGVIVPSERVAKVGDMTLWKIEIKEPPPGQDWRKHAIATTRVTARTTASGTTRPSTTQIARKKKHVAAAKHVSAARKSKAQAKADKLRKQQRQEAAKRAAAKKRKARHAAAATKRAAPAPAATQPSSTHSSSVGGRPDRYARSVLLRRGRRGRIRGPIFRVAQRLDLLARERARARVDAVAALAGGVPRVLVGEVAGPERPRAALERADIVDRADALHLRVATLADARLLEKDAVVQTFRRASLLKTESAGDPATVALDNDVRGELQMLREASDLLFGDPDVPRRAGAAVPALGAGEFETLRVPRSVRRVLQDVQLHASEADCRQLWIDARVR